MSKQYSIAEARRIWRQSYMKLKRLGRSILRAVARPLPYFYHRLIMNNLLYGGKTSGKRTKLFALYQILWM